MRRSANTKFLLMSGASAHKSRLMLGDFDEKQITGRTVRHQGCRMAHMNDSLFPQQPASRVREK